MAEPQAGDSPSVALTWQTSSETNTVGFYIYRKRSDSSGAFIPLSSMLSTVGAQGGDYQYLDEEVEASVEYQYLLVEKQSDGTLFEHTELIQVVVIGASLDNQLWLPLIVSDEE